MENAYLHHICIETSRYAESLSFYRDALGAQLLKETANFHGRAYNTWLRCGNTFIELQTPKEGAAGYNAPKAGPREGLMHICFFVSDLEALYVKLRESGRAVFIPHGGRELYEVCGAKLFKLHAPEGTVIEFRDAPVEF